FKAADADAAAEGKDRLAAGRGTVRAALDRDIERRAVNRPGVGSGRGVYKTLAVDGAHAEGMRAAAQLAVRNQSAASRWVNEIWPQLLVHPNAGVDEPFLVYLTCYRVLAATGDPRAATILRAGYEL